MSSTSVGALGQSSGALSSSSDKSDETYRFIGHVSEIGTEARILLDDLNTLKGKLTAPDFHLDQIAESWRDLEMRIYQDDDAKVKTLLAEIKKQMEDHPVLLEHHGQNMTIIENYWERLDSSWPRFPGNGEPDVRILLHRIDDARDILVGVVCRVGMVTIVSRVNEQLETIRVGQTLDFNATFSETIPDQESRQLALQYLYKHSLSVKGAIDVEHGLIYRASPNVWYRRLSCLIIALPVILGGVIVYLAYTFIPGLTDQTHTVPQFLVAYIALIGGSLFHAFIDTFKQSQEGKGQSFTALGDLVLWVHVKQFAIIHGVLFLWLGFILLAWSQQGTDWVAAFFVGYSIDSVTDIFLQRFTTFASARTNIVQTRLSTLLKPAMIP